MPRIQPTKFAHIVYRTRRFDAMIDWYRPCSTHNCSSRVRCWPS